MPCELSPINTIRASPTSSANTSCVGTPPGASIATLRRTSAAVDAAGRRSGRGGQEPADLLVGDLPEVPKRLTDGQERGRHGRAHNVVDEAGELPARGLRRRRHGNHDLRWLRIAQCLYRREHACAGGQTVIDDNDRLAGDIGGRALAAVGGLAPKQFPTLTFGDVAQLLRCDPQAPHDVVIDHDAAAAGQCTNGELVMPRGTKFAHDEGV